MKLLKLTPAPMPNAQGLPMALIRTVGSADFAADLMQAVSAELRASHCTVFSLRSNGRVEAVSSASAFGEVASLTAVEYVRRGFDLQDSNMVWLRKRKPGKRTALWMGHQFAEDVEDEDYRRLCYGEPGIRERLSLLAVQPNGYRVAASLYRNHSYPDYSARDFEWVSRNAELILSAVIRHAEVVRRPSPDASLQGMLVRELPWRERELISHVLAGRTTKEAARAMSISVTTALTYRYRAFRRLRVNNLRELLSLSGIADMGRNSLDRDVASEPRRPRLKGGGGSVEDMEPG